MHKAITFPTSGAVSQVPGLRRVERPTPDPVPGAGWSFPVRDRPLRLISGQVKLVTSAAVANRGIGVEIDDGSGAIFAYNLATPATAGLTWLLNYVGGLVTDIVDTNNHRATLGIPNVWIPPGYTLKATVDGLDAADQYSGLVLWVEYLDVSSYGLEVGMHDPTLGELVETTELHPGG